MELVNLWRQLSFLNQRSLNNRRLWISKSWTLSLLFLSTDNFRYDHLSFKLCIICLSCLIACIASLSCTVCDSMREYNLHVIVFIEDNLTFFENFTLNSFPAVWLYDCLTWNIKCETIVNILTKRFFSHRLRCRDVDINYLFLSDLS